MQRHFRNTVLAALAALWSTGAQATSFLEPGVTPTEPGAYKELSYRYTFDVVRPGRSSINYIINVDTEEVVTDPVLAQSVKDRIDPLRSSFGKTGRVTIEVSSVLNYAEFTRPDGSIYLESMNEYSLIECKSGFLCDIEWDRYNDPFSRQYLYVRETGFYSINDKGFSLEAGDLRWSGPLGFRLRDFGDYFFRNPVTIDGVTYRGSTEPFLGGLNRSFGGDFGIANFRSKRLVPPPVPLPASGLMLMGVLGGAAFLARRNRRRT
jgi:hypothetical protein